MQKDILVKNSDVQEERKVELVEKQKELL